MKETYNALFIDDREVDNFIVQMEIEHEEIPVNANYVSSAEEALEYLKSIPESEFPDIIMVDLNMPLMNGFEFVEEFVKVWGGKPEELPLIYILSSSIRTSDKELALKDKKIKNFYTKPFNKEVFKQIKNDFLTVVEN